MRNFTRLLLAVVLFFQSMLLVAQERTISGVIRDADDNSPLTGVSVSLKGSTRGVQTDASGAFSIMAKKGDILQISYVGYEMQQVRVGDANTITINLKSTQKALGEVVVVAMDIKRNPRE